jgi:hypothetical protein
MKPNLNDVVVLLQQQHRRNRYAWPLVAVAIGLAATLAVIWYLHPSLARVEKWGHLPRWWIGGLAITSVVGAIVYFLRRKSILQSARAMDVRWATKNRLETVAKLASAPDAIVVAQRAEANDFARQKKIRPVGIPASYPGWLAALLLFIHLILLVIWMWPLNGNSFGFCRNGGSKHAAQRSSGAADTAEQRPRSRDVTKVDPAATPPNKPKPLTKEVATSKTLTEAPADPDRQHPYQLTDEQAAQAPAVYRSAVADYFEQLSRDYPAGSNESGK